MSGPHVAWLADGCRLHLQHGPIDLIIEAWGPGVEVEAAYQQAITGFADILPGLVEELAVLRAPCTETVPAVRGSVARRMIDAVWPLSEIFITPMAAVAGAVADEMLARLCADRRLARAYVNDGGDIALHLAPGERLVCGLVGDLAAPAIDGTYSLTHDLPVRGLATSGWRPRGQGGKSFSFGIADAVSVLADSAAAADAAATLIANAVDLPGHPAIVRAPAIELDPDSDLGSRLVTVEVGRLDRQEIGAALARGETEALRLRRAGHIHGAVLVLRRRCAIVGFGPAKLAAA